jgi:hypothetical protein
VDGNEVKDILIDNIIKVLEAKGVKLNLATDILVYTSHGNVSNVNNNNNTKQSYHIVVDNFCHSNNVEAKAFYHTVMDSIGDSNIVCWVDQAVYSTVQQFRIVGSRKIGSERVKMFNKIWSYHNNIITHKYPEEPDSPEHEFVMQLESSIIGFSGNCRFLPPFEPRPDQIKHYEDAEDVTQTDANEAINLIGLAGKISVTDSRFPYKFMGINGPIVMLKRVRASRCKICDRIHEHENPYLLVIGDEKSVYLHCRRAPEGKKLYLGKLNPDNNPDNNSDNNPDNNSDNNPDNNTDNSKKNKPESPKAIDQVKVNWTKNVIDKVQKLARSGNSNDKKYINGSTNINPNHKKQFIDLYVNTK